MSTRRPILIALIALAVALLPVAGGMALAHDASFTAAKADCCPIGRPCEKKTDGCGSVAGCVLKCCGLTSAIAAPVAVSLTVSALEKPALALQGFRSPAENPPLPPPRV